MQRASWVLAAWMVGAGAGAARAQTAWVPPSGTVTVPLWPGTAPGISGADAAKPEEDTTKPTDNLIAGRRIIKLGNVSRPTLTVYRVAEGAAPAAPAVVVFPGGGYSILAMDLEGTEICEWLTRAGVACVLVKYRVPASGPYPKSEAALDDAQRAVGLVREHAAEWGVDPKRVGALGFSAGAHLVAALSTHFGSRLYPRVDAADDMSCRPDFAFVLYPGYLALADKAMARNEDIKVGKDAPPTFVLQAEDDPVHVENAVNYFLQLKQAGVEAELHIFAKGGHGYGLRRNGLAVTEWDGLAERWMRGLGVVK